MMRQAERERERERERGNGGGETRRRLSRHTVTNIRVTFVFEKSQNVNAWGPRGVHACHDKWVP
jgi:hypothetical protein